MTKHEQLLEFLQEHLAIPTSSIELGLRQSREAPSLLPMVLYQYGPQFAANGALSVRFGDNPGAGADFRLVGDCIDE